MLLGESAIAQATTTHTSANTSVSTNSSASEVEKSLQLAQDYSLTAQDLLAPETDAVGPEEIDPEEADPEAADPVAPRPFLLPDEPEGLRFTITGTRTRLPIFDLPATVSVFEQEDFQFYQVNSLRDLFRYEPGVSVREDALYGAQDVNIRGIEGNRILFQVDGIRLPERFLFGPFNIGRGEYVDFATLQAIEVLRGPASTLYGSDALGGVVTYRSLRPADLLGPDRTVAGDVSTLYRSATGGFDQVGRLALRQGPAEGVVVISRQDGRELSNFGSDRFRDGISRGDTNFYGNLVYNLSDVSQLSFIVEDINRRTEYVVAPGNLLTGPPTATNLRNTGENQIDRTRLSLAYEFDDPDQPGWLQYTRAQLFYQTATTTETTLEFRPSGIGPGFAGAPARRDSRNRFIADSYGGDIQLRSDFTTGEASHRLTYGLDVSTTFNSRPRDRTQTNLRTGATTNVIAGDVFPLKDFADGDTFRFGAYLQDQITLGNFDLIAGLRFDSYDLQTKKDSAFQGQAVSLNTSALSPRLALLYRATPELALYTQYARGFRAPLYSEITSGFTNLAGQFFKYETLSNPNLQAESSDSFEVGLRGQYDWGDFRLVGFHNTYDNFIATNQLVGQRCLIPAPVCPPTQIVNRFQSINIGSARIYGLELGGEYRFTPGESGFSLLASAALVQGDDVSRDRPLETIDPVTAVVGLRYRAPDDRWRAELISTFVGTPRVPEGTTSFIPKAYAVVDLVGRYNITPNLGLSLGVYNLLNQEYYTYSEVRNRQNIPDAIRQFSQPGTNLRLGLNYTF